MLMIPLLATLLMTPLVLLLGLLMTPLVLLLAPAPPGLP